MTHSSNAQSLSHAMVRCLMVPIRGGQLLLPASIVAEVTAYHAPEKLDNDNQPDWLLGNINWRNQRVPLLSLENMLSLSFNDATSHQRTVILYGLEINHTIPFYGFLTTDIPHTLSVMEEDLKDLASKKTLGIAFNLKIRDQGKDEAVILPDITYVENLLKKLH